MLTIQNSVIAINVIFIICLLLYSRLHLINIDTQKSSIVDTSSINIISQADESVSK